MIELGLITANCADAAVRFVGLAPEAPKDAVMALPPVRQQLGVAAVYQTVLKSSIVSTFADIKKGPIKDPFVLLFLCC